jgi:predicted XRE-type DNA-binding protein
MKRKPTIKELIKSKGLSQRWIAEDLGVHESLISLAAKHENFPAELRTYLEGK